jgi:hypothetical protein
VQILGASWEVVELVVRDPHLTRKREQRHFCPDCGTGLFYTNSEILPGIIDTQSATYDDPASGGSAGWSTLTNCQRSSATRHGSNPVGHVTREMTSASGHGGQLRWPLAVRPQA